MNTFQLMRKVYIPKIDQKHMNTKSGRPSNCEVCAKRIFIGYNLHLWTEHGIKR